jgi:hypothetical protein
MDRKACALACGRDGPAYATTHRVMGRETGAQLPGSHIRRLPVSVAAVDLGKLFQRVPAPIPRPSTA